MSSDEEIPDSDLAVQVAKPKLKKPPLFKVVLVNDDYTPMEFVVEVLQVFFSLDQEKATRIMLHVHTKGKGVCGVYTRDCRNQSSTGKSIFAGTQAPFAL